MEKCSLLGGLAKIFVFRNSLDLISCNFSMIFTHFQTKGTLLAGPKPFSEGANIGAGGGGGALAPPVYMLKKALIYRMVLVVAFFSAFEYIIKQILNSVFA